MIMNKTPKLVVSAVLCWGIISTSFAASFTTTATSDAFVATGPTGSLSDNNYGGGGALAVAASGLPNGEFQTAMRFDLSGAQSSFDALFGAGQWLIQSVVLQLTSSPHSNAIYNDIAPGLFAVSLMQNNSWVEGTGNASNPSANGITFNTLQNTFINNATDQALGMFNFPGGSSGTHTYSLSLLSDLPADVLSGDDVSLRLFAADSSVSYLFSSRAQGATDRPQLIITAVPEPSALALFGLASGILLFCRGRFCRAATKQPRA
jgi:hypothetical protein